MTPPTHEQVAALEHMARNLIGHPTVGYVMTESTAQAILALCETVREMQAEEHEVRTVLWLRHGHTGQYGDDGEMQCGACIPFYDYKRRRLSEVASTALIASQNTRDAAVARAEQAERERDDERGNADLLTQRVHERDQEIAQMKRESKREQQFTNGYITRLHKAEATIASLQAALADARAVADMVSETARDRQ